MQVHEITNHLFSHNLENTACFFWQNISLFVNLSRVHVSSNINPDGIVKLSLENSLSKRIDLRAATLDDKQTAHNLTRDKHIESAHIRQFISFTN